MGKMTKLWENNYMVDSEVEEFTVGSDNLLDQKLIGYDCQASIAYAKMLAKKGFITKEEEENLTLELNKIIERSENGAFEIAQSDEDCHTAIENHLTAKLGNTGKKIHTGRSRNEQVLVALRLYYKDELQRTKKSTEVLIDNIKKFAEKYGETKMPGYTHMRKAMPSSVGVWAGSFVDSMKDNIKILNFVLSLVDQCPLGTGAGYGSPIKADQNFLAKELGFSKTQKNPIYCQNSRGKFESNILHTLTQIMADLNKIASDLILFSMPEFSFFELPEELCTGSSLMPQKKNPDVLEVLRANYQVVLGLEHQVKTIGSNLPSGYNRDIQLTKEPVMKGIEITQKCLGMASLLFSKLMINKKNCEGAMTNELFATDKVHELVKEGVPFRDAYKQVASSGKWRKEFILAGI